MESYRPTALANLLKKNYQPFKMLFFQLLKSLSLDNQFKSFVLVFERTTFSSFKFWMSNLVYNASALSLATGIITLFNQYES